jgi:predicted nucleic acid-binding protein
MIAEFLDTNVLVYAYDSRAGSKHASAISLLQRLFGAGSAALSVQILVEFYAAATKGGMKAQRAGEIISDLRICALHRTDHADVVRAIELARRYKISWWDALVVNSANELGCEVLWSEDMNHGQRYGGVTVRNPFL